MPKNAQEEVQTLARAVAEMAALVQALNGLAELLQRRMEALRTLAKTMN